MFTVDRMSDSDWLKAINDSTFRRIAYGAGRDFVESLSGGEKNACAAVHSTAQCLRGVFSEIYYNTVQVEQACLDAGMSRFKDWRTIRAGDTLFAEDENKNGKSDHVYLAASAPDERGMIFVFDNYGAEVYQRNLLSGGKYTPFLFGMRLVEVERPLTGVPAQIALLSFRGFYNRLLWGKLPVTVQRQINRLRANGVFGNLSR